MSAAPKLNDSHEYLDLEKEIAELHSFAEPLQDEVIVTPLMDVIAIINDLPLKLEGMDPKKVEEINRKVRACRMTLDNFAYSYVKRIITHPEPSKVFKILSKADLFQKELRKAVGKEIPTDDGTTMVMTPEIVAALTRYRFSIGSPPVTPQGIETLEKMVFGNSLPDIYQFRDLLGGDAELFDAFIANTERLMSQSTHYTTSDEKKKFEKNATDFTNFEGMRGLTKSVVSGTANTAARLIRDHLFSQHSNGSHPVKEVKERNKLDDALITEMKNDKETIFIVKVSEVNHHVFTDDKLKAKWQGILGRLIIVDDSDNSRRANTTMVYTLLPDLTQTLDKLHVKDSGTPANTQMNLRSILENFSTNSFSRLSIRIRTKIAEFEGEGIHLLSPDEVRKKEWLLGRQKDYLSLKKFLEFIVFVENLKKAGDEELATINGGLIEENEKGAMRYFFKEVESKGHKGVYVPQGGGRKEIGHIGDFFSQKFDQRIKAFKTDKLAELKARLATLKEDRGIGVTQEAAYSIERSLLQNRSREASIRDAEDDESSISPEVITGLKELARKGVSGADTLLAKLESTANGLTTNNLTGRARRGLGNALKGLGIPSFGKRAERGLPRDAANLMRQAVGTLRRYAGNLTTVSHDILDKVEAKLQVPSISLAESMLKDIEKDALKPNLALAEVGWTFNDVLDEEEFPQKNYLKIDIDSKGELDIRSLKRQLEITKQALRDFPELFEIYCASTLLIVNNPHNPTSRVATYATKIQLLEVASEYNLTIMSDEAYHKQVKEEVKYERGEMTMAQLYEDNRARFKNPITIHTSLPTTKWAMGGGRRTGIVVSNEKETVNGQTFEEFVRSRTDGVNTMSLYLDRDSYGMGILVKQICAKLEAYNPATQRPDKLIDGLLVEHFGDLSKTNHTPIYFALIQARNDYDRLKIRDASKTDYIHFVDNLITSLKKFRLDKRTQKDSAERSKAVATAIERVSVDYPGIKETSIEPEGPFYVCVKLDNGPQDSSLYPFLEAIARARNIDAVPTAKGYVRFAFGGMVDGTDEGYGLLSVAVETNLRVLLKYWEQFKTKREEFHKAKKSNPEALALKDLFPGGEIEFVRTYQDKIQLIEAMGEYHEKNRRQVAFNNSADVSEMITSIEPDSEAHIVTLRDIKCKSAKEFVHSKPFQNLFNHYLLKVSAKVPALKFMKEFDVVATYGAREFEDKFNNRGFKNDEKEIFSQIVIEIAKIWFSDNTVKILSLEDPNADPAKLMGTEAMLSNYIREFLLAFVTPEQFKALLASFNEGKDSEYVGEETKLKPSIQAGYRSIRGVKAHSSIPKWGKNLIGSVEFAQNTTATDFAPELKTTGTARVPGVDRAILRRDGDGKNAPKAEFFSNRLEKFTETMNPKDYVCKMIHVGGTKVLLVMNRSYSHYMVEELRLFPQEDLSFDDIQNCKPDAVSFLGLPPKVMGEDYRIGYFMDKDSDGQSIPVSWVDRESITDYMGYLKKPILTVANEKVKEKEMLPIHGSAFSIVFKNGLRKTMVMAGDSGTGKSETIIAMIEQIIGNTGLADQVEGIEFLSGDMLSLFEGDDGQMYMLGTEEGDFMRMTDIPSDWKERFRDRLARGSKTNLKDKLNPRVTVGGLCDPQLFQKPVRVNGFANINNFEIPTESAFVKTDSPSKLLLQEYIRGYRGEKGTSGDQPNIFKSVGSSNRPDKDKVLADYSETLDKLLGWDILTDAKTGKAANAYLGFNDLPDQMPEAKTMIKRLFKGEKFDFSITPEDIKKGKKSYPTCDGKKVKIENDRYTIKKTHYNIHTNHFQVDIVGARTKKSYTIDLDRETVFSKIYNPIASTVAGNPFIDPRGLDKILERFAGVMEKAGVFTGTLYTQLKVAGQEFGGPARASQDMIRFMLQDKDVNERFQTHLREVDEKLRAKYGDSMLDTAGTIPDPIMAYNLLNLELHESATIRPVDSRGGTIDLKTPLYQYNSEVKREGFRPRLVTRDAASAILDICNSEQAVKQFNLEELRFDLSKYKFNPKKGTGIKSCDSKEELIYQIMIINGVSQLAYNKTDIARSVAEVKKAEKIANEMIKKRMVKIPDAQAQAA